MVERLQPVRRPPAASAPPPRAGREEVTEEEVTAMAEAWNIEGHRTFPSLTPGAARRGGGGGGGEGGAQAAAAAAAAAAGLVPLLARAAGHDGKGRGRHLGPGGPTALRSLGELAALARGTAEEAAAGGGGEEDGGGAEEGEEGKEGETVEADLSFSAMTEESYREMLLAGGTAGRPGGAGAGAGEEEEEEEDGGEEDGSDEDDAGGNDGEAGDDDDEEAPWAPWDDDGAGAGAVDDDQAGGGILDFFGDGDDDDGSDGEPDPGPRPFLLLWGALAGWATPATAEVLEEWGLGGGAGAVGGEAEAEAETAPARSLLPSARSPYDTTDVGASRCGGLMSMLRMNLGRALEELGYDPTDSHLRRRAEGRLASLARTFGYPGPAPAFNRPLWRAATAVLTDACFPPSVLYSDVLEAEERASGGKEGEGKGTGVRQRQRKIPSPSPARAAPPSVTALGITDVEYRYLTRSAFQSLAAGGGVLLTD